MHEKVNSIMAPYLQMETWNLNSLNTHAFILKVLNF
jgi:hypothetical protein